MLRDFIFAFSMGEYDLISRFISFFKSPNFLKFLDKLEQAKRICKWKCSLFTRRER